MIVAATSTPSAVIRLNPRTAKSPKGTSGERCWRPRCWRTKAAPSAVPAPSSAQIRPSQLSCAPWLRPRLRQSRDEAASATPGRSRRTPPGGASPGAASGIASRPSTIASTPTGTFSQNTQRQSSAPTSSPPSTGAVTAATPLTAPRTPKAAPRRSAG